MLLRYLKERFSAYSSLVMLISRKPTQDKRVVADFIHLNVRIAKNNLAYPLLKDTLMGLKGNYKNHQYYIYQIIKADYIYCTFRH